MSTATARRLRRAGLGLCLLGAALGLAGLTGWLMGEHWLTTVIPGRPPMIPNTACGLLLAGLAGALRAGQPARWSLRGALSLAAGAIVLFIGVATLGEYIAGVSLGIDELLFRTPAPSPYAGRMSPPTAMAFALLGGALVTFDSILRGGRPAQWLAAAAALVGLVTLVAHAHGAGAIYQLARAPVVGVALPTAIAILAISIGCVLLRPAAGLLAMVSASGAEGKLLRSLGIGTVLAPPLLGLVVSLAIRGEGMRDVPLALALLTSAMVPMGLLIVYVTGTRLRRSRQELEVSREQITTLVEQASDGIFVADLDGRYTEVNDAGCCMLGCTRAEIVGKTILDFIPAEEVERLLVDKERMLKGMVSVAEWHLRRKDGSFVPAEVSAKILADGRWQGLVRDISERKVAEREAQRSRARLEGIISIASDGIISIDDQQRIVLYNRGAETIFGWPAAEVLGQPVEMLIPERFRNNHARHVADFASEQSHSRAMGSRQGIFGLRRNGQEFPAEASISKVEIEGRLFFNVVVRDVTAAMELQRELRDARDFLDNVLQSSVGYGIVALDLQRRVVLWNEGARRNFGYDSGEIVGKSIDVLHMREDLDAGGAQSLYAAGLDKGTAEAVIWLKRKDGSSFVAQVVIARRVGPDQRPTGYLVVSRDVSFEQQQVEHERLLAESGVALGSTLDAYELADHFAKLAIQFIADGCAVVLLERGGDFDQMALRHRDPAKVAVARALEELPLERGKPRLISTALDRRRSAVLPYVTDEYLESVAQNPEHLRLLQALEIASLMISPIVIRGELLGLVLFISTTERRRYNSGDLSRAEELIARLGLALDNAHLYAATQQAVAGRDEVLRIVAHDLRSPLGAARLSVERLLRSPVGEERRQNTRDVGERIQRSLDRATKLIDNLLDVSKLEAGRLQIEPKVTSPERLAQDAVELLGPAATAASLSLSLEVQPDLPAVWADPERIVQVLANLLGNAVKFVPAGGHLRVTVDRHQGMVQFSVADDGPGIPAEQLPHLFDRFWQGQMTDRRGAGLGLAIVKGLVDAHGGTLRVDSQEGEGTTFSFALPPAAELEVHVA